MPRQVIIGEPTLYATVRDALADLPIEVLSGAAAIVQAVTDPEVDTVVTAMVGYSGLEPTIAAIGAGKRIALANKETLVVAGELINDDSHDVKVAMLEKMSQLNGMYSADDDNMQMLYFKNATATITSFTEASVTLKF